MTGRSGQFSVGALNIQTDDEPTAEALATNFTVVRLETRHPPSGAGSVASTPAGRSPWMARGRTKRTGSTVPSPSTTASTSTGTMREHVPRVARGTTRVTRRRLPMTVTSTAFRSTICSSATTSTRRSGFCAARTFGERLWRRSSARVPNRSERYASLLGGRTSTTSRTVAGQVETRTGQLKFSTELENSDRVNVDFMQNLRAAGRAFRDYPGHHDSTRGLSVW